MIFHVWSGLNSAKLNVTVSGAGFGASTAVADREAYDPAAVWHQQRDTQRLSRGRTNLSS